MKLRWALLLLLGFYGGGIGLSLTLIDLGKRFGQARVFRAQARSPDALDHGHRTLIA